MFNDYYDSEAGNGANMPQIMRETCNRGDVEGSSSIIRKTTHVQELSTDNPDNTT